MSINYEPDGSITLYRNDQRIGEVVIDPETGQVKAINGSINLQVVESTEDHSVQLQFADSTVLNVQKNSQGLIEAIVHSEAGPLLSAVRNFDQQLLSHTDQTDSTTNVEGVVA